MNSDTQPRIDYNNAGFPVSDGKLCPFHGDICYANRCAIYLPLYHCCSYAATAHVNIRTMHETEAIRHSSLAPAKLR